MIIGLLYGQKAVGVINRRPNFIKTSLIFVIELMMKVSSDTHIWIFSSYHVSVKINSSRPYNVIVSGTIDSESVKMLRVGN